MIKFCLPLFCIAILNLSAQDKIEICENLEIQKISTHCYVHISYKDLKRYNHVPANGLVVIQDSVACIIDTPWDNALSDSLYTWLEESQGVTATKLIVGHWHIDCAGGLAFLNRKGVESIGSKLTNKILKSKHLPSLKTTFKSDYQTEINGLQLQAYYPGGAHAQDNIVVYIPEDKVLFGGCMIKALNAKNLGNLSDADLPAWPNSLKNIQKKFPDTKLIVPGHGRPGNQELIVHTQDLLKN